MTQRQEPPGYRRNRLAGLLALLAVVCLGSAFLFFKDTQFLMPGPLASAHGTIETCSACHTKSGSGKVDWMHGLIAGDPLGDSKACLSCHKMAETAFNAHGASAEVLKESTARLTKMAAKISAPVSARAQSIAFPTRDLLSRDLYCATCHQEHQGANFDLNKISNEQCRSCHVVKFDGFDRNHPDFESYPFERRTRIIYDHAGHFGKHFPEIAKKDPAKQVPATCSTCHNSSDDKRVMAVVPFDKTCTSCHLDQIIGRERVSGPKGIAFLSLPGLDLQALKKKSAAIGEWPDASDAGLTPFMKLIIARTERGRALVKAVDPLNLQDLTDATDEQIKAVTDLVWEIKSLYYALISEKASDVLANLTIGDGPKLSASVVAGLTANIPRDVVISAQQDWLPNLATEMAKRREASDQKQESWSPVITGSSVPGSSPPEGQSGSPTRPAALGPGQKAKGSEGGRDRAAQETDTANAKPEVGQDKQSRRTLPPKMRAGIDVPDEGAASEGAATDADPASTDKSTETTPSTGEEGVIQGRSSLPSGTPRSIKARSKEAGEAAEPRGAVGKPAPSNENIKGSQGAKGADPAPRLGDGGSEKPPANDQPQATANEQTDDLLFPTEEERRASNAVEKDAKQSAGPQSADAKTSTQANAPAGTPAGSDSAAANPHSKALPATSIESDIDPESWAEHGGWYRQDHAIFYRPTGHKDKFIYSWLTLTGPEAPKGGPTPAAAVFDALTNKDAQGSCTKCHSVDDVPGKGRLVNFSPPSSKTKQGRFTKFLHEPHFGTMDETGCLSCHKLEKARPYLKSFEHGNPLTFVSNFSSVKKDQCQTCHTSSKARQDCLLCHTYHVPGVITPVTKTKIPTE